MKNTAKSIILLFLVFVLLCFASCKQDSPTPGPVDPLPTEQTVPQGTIDVPKENIATNTLHKVNVTASSNTFIVNGKTDYIIITTNQTENVVGANFIKSHLEQATGSSIKVALVEDNQTCAYKYSADAKYIVINVSTLFAQAGLTMPTDDIGAKGFYIKSAGKSVFIQTKALTGVQYGAITFLKHVIGYDMFDTDCVTYTRDASTIPTMEIVEKPDMPQLMTTYRMEGDVYGMGYLQDNIFIPGPGNETWHNSMEYLPKSEYLVDHPKWYSDNGDELCYSAHGDADELNAMAQTVAEKMLECASRYPGKNTIALTIEDFRERQCFCSACVKVAEDYNNAHSAAAVKLMNKIDDIIQAELQKQADENGTKKRDLKIMFFAYYWMEKPPVKWDEAKQKWVPIDDSVICNENVGPYIAPIQSQFTQSLYSNDNLTTKQCIEGWSAVSNNLYLWLYQTNFAHYLYPYNCWESMLDSYKMGSNNNAVYMYNQAQWNQGNPTAFSRLKAYIDTRAAFNSNDSYADILDDFFAGYFRDAAQPMRNFFDELVTHMRYLEATDEEITGSIYLKIESPKYWPYQTLNKWLGYIDQAYKAIEKYKYSDPELYQMLHDHINLESIFPRFAIIRNYSGKFSDQQLLQMRISFKQDCNALGVTMLRENSGATLDTLFNTWGI